MGGSPYTGLLLVAAVACAAPLLVGLVPRLRLPSVVVEMLAGILIGPAVLGWVRIDAPIQLLAAIGLSFLLFLAGMEIDIAELRGPAIKLAGPAFLVSVVLAVVAGYAVVASGVKADAPLLAVIFVATSLGLLVPVLKDTGETSSPFGQLVIMGGTLGEFGSLLLLTLFFSQDSDSTTLSSRLILLVVFVLAVVAIVLGVIRAWHSAWFLRQLLRLEDSSSQLRVRVAMLILIVFVAIAGRLGLEAILGAFVAGVIVRRVNDDGGLGFSQFRSKLEAVGYGFVVPVFFVSSGLRFDLHSLVTSTSALARVPLFLVLLLLVRGLPALLYHEFGRKSVAAAAFLQATSLTFIVVATHIGSLLHEIDPATAAGLVAAGLLSVVIFPAVALALRPWQPGVAAPGVTPGPAPVTTAPSTRSPTAED